MKKNELKTSSGTEARLSETFTYRAELGNLSEILPTSKQSTLTNKNIAATAPPKSSQTETLRVQPVKWKLSHEFSNAQLKAFTFGCIEAVASLKGSAFQSMVQECLILMIEKHLCQFPQLAQESRSARDKFKASSRSSKEFASSIKPLIDNKSQTPEQLQQLTNKALKLVAQSMRHQKQAQDIHQRLVDISKTLPKYVMHTGEELQFPPKVMAKLAKRIQQALHHLISY